MKKSTFKTIVKEELKAAKKSSLSEGVSVEAAQLHAMTSCGQDAAQNFIDDNGLDAKKLVNYVQQGMRTNPTLKYDVRDYISGAKGTVGGEKNLRDKFIKQFKMGLKEADDMKLFNTREDIIKALASEFGEKPNGFSNTPTALKFWTYNRLLHYYYKKKEEKRTGKRILPGGGSMDLTSNLKEVGPAYKSSSFVQRMTPDNAALYREYVQKIDVTDPNAINNHDTLQKVMLNDPRVQKSNQKQLLQTALGWAITFAQEMER